MNATEPGLYNAIDFMDGEDGTPEARRDAAKLVHQAAGLALVCSLAFDNVVYGDCVLDCDAEEVAGIASRLMFKCHNDLTVAKHLIGA